MQVFLLLIGVTLIILNIKAINKEKNSFQAVLQDREDNTTETEIIMGELRREFSETILELQKEIMDLKESLKEYKAIDEKKLNSVEAEFIIDRAELEVENTYSEEEMPITEVKNDTTDKQIESLSVEKSNSVKIEEVGKLLKKGVSIDMICEKLSIGKGEVLLIKELYLK